MHRRLTATLPIVACLLCSLAVAAERGSIKLDVLDELGAGAKPPAAIFAGDKKVAEVEEIREHSHH